MKFLSTKIKSMTTTNIMYRSAKAGATLFFANYKIDAIVQNETIVYSLGYMLGRNESSCLINHVYHYYPNYSEYEIKERIRVFIVSIFRTKNKNKLIRYLVTEAENELIKVILRECTKTSIEKLYEFLNADKRRNVFDSSILGIIKRFTNFKD